MSEDYHGRQGYEAQDHHLIRRAQNRTWQWLIIVIVVGLVLARVSYNPNDPNSASSLAFLCGSILIVAGFIALPLYLILAISTANWTRRREGDIINQWSMIANDPERAEDSPLKQMANAKLARYNNAPKPSVTCLERAVILAAIIGVIVFISGYFQ